jgi:hypothetical protein
MPWMGFEPTLSVFERANTFHTSDRATTVIGNELYKCSVNPIINPNPIYSHPHIHVTIWSRFRRDSEPRMTVLARPSSNLPDQYSSTLSFRILRIQNICPVTDLLRLHAHWRSPIISSTYVAVLMGTVWLSCVYFCRPNIINAVYVL